VPPGGGDGGNGTAPPIPGAAVVCRLRAISTTLTDSSTQPPTRTASITPEYRSAREHTECRNPDQDWASDPRLDEHAAFAVSRLTPPELE